MWMQGDIDISAIYDFGFKLCCVDFYWNVESSIRSTIPEYSENMCHLSNNRGLILCPDCLIERLECNSGIYP